MGLGSLLGLMPDLSKKLARCYIIPLNYDGSRSELNIEPVAKGFQFWPESVNDSKGSNWEAKTIPGGSHPLYQWESGGERTISFTLVFSRDTQDVEPSTNWAQEDIHNVDVGGALSWLRSMTLPTYVNSVARPPPFLLLVFPKAGMGYSGTLTGTADEILCVMTQCDVTYESFFNDGTPRMATVDVSFSEVVQDPSGIVQFVGRENLADSSKMYALDPKPSIF